MPSLAAAFHVEGARGFLRAATRLAWGNLDYEGHVQSADASRAGVPATSTSGAVFLHGEVEGGALLGPARRVALFGGLGARRWSREIRSTWAVSRTGVSFPVQGLSEVYSWYELQAGVRWTFLETFRAAWDAEARLVRTAAPRIAVDLLGTKIRLELGARTGWRLASTFRWALPAESFLVAGGWAEAYAFGASAVDPVYLILEPSSETLNVGFDVGLGRRF